MGTALAGALLTRGHRVIVWNRTSEKAASLVASGATLATSLEEAVAASSLVIMCVLDYSVANIILAEPGVADAVRGKVFVQLSAGVPEQVYGQQNWIREHSGQFIAGGIIAYPRNIGKASAVIVYAGDTAAFEEHCRTLSVLAGSQQWLGSDPGVAMGAHFALSSYLIGALGLFFETASVARYYGLPMDVYYLLVRLITDEVIEGIRDGAHRVSTGNFDGRLASIDLTAAGMQEVCSSFARTGIPAKMTEALVAQLKLASAQGDGDKDISRLVETLWSQRER
jgi:3-hydroxyisobutyrate dehydrogenase-like beta-hydroxyacid dehydrogenase